MESKGRCGKDTDVWERKRVTKEKKKRRGGTTLGLRKLF